MKICFLFIMFLFSVPLYGNAPEEIKIFVDEHAQFSFNFSGDWRKLDKKANNIDEHFVVVKKERAIAEVIITHEKPEKKIPLEKYLENEKKRIEKTPGYTKINENKGFKIGGHPSAWLLLNVVDRDFEGRTFIKKVSQYIIQKDDVFWGITIITSDEDVDVLAEIQRTMVKSFEFGTGGRVSLSPVSKEEIKTVVDPDQRFSIRVPQSWKLIESKGTSLSFESEAGLMHIFVLPQDNQDSKISLSNFIVSNERLEKTRSLSDAPFFAGSERGHLINYEGEKAGAVYHVQLALIQKGKSGFYLYFITTPEKWKKNTGLITGVQSTFSFIKSRISETGKTGLPEFLLLTEDNKTDEIKETELAVTPAEKYEVSNKLLWEPFSKDNVPR